MNEEKISSTFEGLLDSFSITEDLASQVAEALNKNHVALQAKLRREEANYKRALRRLEEKEDELYYDMKDGLFDEVIYKRRIGEVRRERARYSDLLIGIQNSVNEVYLKTAQDILELAKNAKLYWNHLGNTEKVQLLKKVVWNPTITNASIEYEIKKPFKILQEMKGLSNIEKWGRVHKCTHSLAEIHFHHGLSNFKLHNSFKRIERDEGIQRFNFLGCL